LSSSSSYLQNVRGIWEAAVVGVDVVEQDLQYHGDGLQCELRLQKGSPE
jgi:hypothetical protein